MTLLLITPVLLILGTLIAKGGGAISWEFLFTAPTDGMRSGGVFPALLGTVWLVTVALLLSVPIGVFAAIYLSEYAGDNWFTRIINLAIINLAGVPSIVHALFGLGAFVLYYKVGTGIQTASDYKPQDVTAQTTTIAMDKQLDETKPTVTIGSAANGFVPTTITIKKGATVTWTNNDSSEHSIVGKNWGSNKNLKYNESWSYTFNEVGSFDYHCGIHPVMQGTINVVN
jgi:plastocyanin